MPDYSSSTAQIPENPPRDLDIDETIVDTTDRDSATPDQVAGAHLNALENEATALYGHLIANCWGYVEDGSGLDVIVHAGRANKGTGTIVAWAKDASYTLDDDDTNYVYVDAAGTVSHSTTAFPAEAIPLAEIVTAGGDVSSVTDKRPFFYVGGAQYLLADGTRGLSGDLDVGDHEVRAQTLYADSLLKALKMTFDAATELTISTGAVTATQGFHTVDTEEDAASDDLDTISGGGEGMLLIVRAEHTDRTVILKHGTGNLQLAGADVTLDDTDEAIMLIYDAGLSKWLKVN